MDGTGRKIPIRHQLKSESEVNDGCLGQSRGDTHSIAPEINQLYAQVPL